MKKNVLIGCFTVTAAIGTLLLHSPVAHADTGNYSETKYAKNGQLVLSTSGTWTSNASNGWVWFDDAKVTFEGESHLKWWGVNPFNADNIILTNTISVDKVWGSFSAGAEVGYPSGVSINGGMTISSTENSQSYTYAVSNAWKNNVYYTYNARVGGFWLTANFKYSTTSVTQLGSDFYQQTTDEISI